MNNDMVIEHFAKQVSEYEQLMSRLIPQYKEQHQIICSLLPAKNVPCRVLDLGCGNGVVSEYVLSQMPDAHLTGFDLTDDMLSVAQKKLSEFDGRFELCQGDYRTDTIGSDYDVIIASLTLHHLTPQERQEFYSKLYQALNDGGILIMRDIIIDADEAIAEDQYTQWKQFMHSQGEDSDFWYSKHCNKDNPVTLEDHYQWLREAGFTKVACQYRIFNFAITTAEKQ